MSIQHIVTMKDRYWRESEIEQSIAYEDTLVIGNDYRQTVYGFGGCFNEMGWDVLSKIPKAKREAILDELFCRDGLNLQTGRVSIGANDYSLEWYSCDEKNGDYGLKEFNIERDKKYSIPYIKEALKRQPDMHLFASPWSPPVWMKTKKVYNHGRLRMDAQIKQAYAEYLLKFIESYKNEGITVHQIHVQNEPVADQKFPSCTWTGEQLRDFIKNYLGPVFEKAGYPAEIWLGTLNGPFIDFQMQGSAPFSEFYDQYVNTVLADSQARNFISGVGFQWGGKHVIEQVEVSYPELHIMQTENECGDGRNTWEHAEYVYGLFWHYFYHRAERYTYWNMVLPKGGISTWGWEQNSLLTIDEQSGEVTFEPEFYLMKHFSHFVEKGARVIRTEGHWTANSVVFENPDGTVIAVVSSNMNNPREITVKYPDGYFSAIIEPHSIHTFVIQKK